MAAEASLASSRPWSVMMSGSRPPRRSRSRPPLGTAAQGALIKGSAAEVAFAWSRSRRLAARDGTRAESLGAHMRADETPTWCGSRAPPGVSPRAPLGPPATLSGVCGSLADDKTLLDLEGKGVDRPSLLRALTDSARSSRQRRGAVGAWIPMRSAPKASRLLRDGDAVVRQRSRALLVSEERRRLSLAGGR